eukprot:COSAG02_NODE_22116_length_762_cov_54.055807_1_plen_98_part_10
MNRRELAECHSGMARSQHYEVDRLDRRFLRYALDSEFNNNTFNPAMSVSHFSVPPGPNYLPPPQRFAYADWNAGGPIRSGLILLNPDDKTGDVERMSQ